MSNGPDHYREAERLLAEAHVPPSKRAVKGWCTADELVAAAQVHATLALAAAYAETNRRPDEHPLVLRPLPGDDVDPPYPGNDWGRALYGEVGR